jgi:hypothetical protein
MNTQKSKIHNLTMDALRRIEAAESLEAEHDFVKCELVEMAIKDLEIVCSLTE